MHSCRDAIEPGDIVARQGQYFVVVGLVVDQLKLVAVRSGEGPRHRADVAANEGPAASGVLSPQAVLACRVILSGHRRHYVRLGRVQSPVLARVVAALQRERMAQRSESVGGIGSHLMALTASSGRRLVPGRTL